VRPFQLTLAAEEDLFEIETYLSAQREHAAETVLDDIEATCRLLGEHPGVGRHRDELGPGVMSFPVGSYVVFDADPGGAVVILRILHGHRDIPNVF
jgi:toxin ParE1/3/4